MALAEDKGTRLGLKYGKLSDDQSRGYIVKLGWANIKTSELSE